MDDYTARLQGQLFGLSILVTNCLGNIAKTKQDPIGFLDRMQEEAFGGITGIEHPDIAPEVQEAFRDAARFQVSHLLDNLKGDLDQEL